MATEIERKYLLCSDAWRASIDETLVIRQGYMTKNGQASVRVRIQNDSANLNIKSMTIGIQRSEYEYAIPLADAHEMLDHLCEKPLIEKTRYHVNYAGKLWEIDAFSGDNEGLVVAEVELQQADEAIELPDWVGQEVSGLERYYNVSLVKYPFRQWTDIERNL